MIISAHQANYLPGLNVVDKLDQADAVIWLDEVQFSHGGWSNRNRMPDGSWLTVPVDRATDMAPFNRVRIADRQWRRTHVRTLEQHYGAEAAARLAAEIERPYGLLIGLNLALLRLILDDRNWHFQSHLDGGHAVVAVSDSPFRLAPISERLAMMVAELGGTTYLSGPSGRRYLDEQPFRDRGIAVDYYEAGDTRCCACLLSEGARVR